MAECNEDGCNYKVWARGKCKMHTPRTPLKKTSTKGVKRTAYRIPSRRKGWTPPPKNLIKAKLKEFYVSLWEKRPHVCESCDAWLGNEIRSYMFDHILEKEIYEDLILEEENIMFLCLTCHDNKTRGHPSARVVKRRKLTLIKFNKK